MKLLIQYKGETIGSLSAGQTAIIPKGKEFKSDIVIRAVEDVSLISFTINNTTYYSPEGWTWSEWVADTTYNTYGYQCSSSLVYYSAPETGTVFYNDIAVSPSEPIVEGRKYIQEQTSGGSN